MGKPKTVGELFKGRHFDRGIVILCVRWYLSEPKRPHSGKMPSQRHDARSTPHPDSAGVRLSAAAVKRAHRRQIIHDRA